MPSTTISGSSFDRNDRVPRMRIDADPLGRCRTSTPGKRPTSMSATVRGELDRIFSPLAELTAVFTSRAFCVPYPTCTVVGLGGAAAGLLEGVVWHPSSPTAAQASEERRANGGRIRRVYMGERASCGRGGVLPAVFLSSRMRGKDEMRNSENSGGPATGSSDCPLNEQIVIAVRGRIELPHPGPTPPPPRLGRGSMTEDRLPRRSFLTTAAASVAGAAFGVAATPTPGRAGAA